MTRRRVGRNRVLAALAAGACLRCAHVEPPPGGPVDSIPPAVVATYPAPGARDVSLDADLAVQFSEWMDRDVRGRILLSPPLPGKPKLEVDGNRLILRPSSQGGLRPNTAYRLTVIGTKDLHGMALARHFSLAFTTGGDFDSGYASGRALVPDRRGLPLAALYRPDSAGEAWRGLPAYLAPGDSAGFFRFDSVAQGEYALLAFADLNGNFRPDPGFEPIGVGASALPLRPRAPESDGGLRLAPLDTLPLRMVSARFSADTVAGEKVAGILRLKFNRQVRPGPAADPLHYRLMPEESGDSAAVTEAGWDAASGEWVLSTTGLRAGARYRLAAAGIPDLSGNANPAGDTAAFTPESAPDTAAWTLSFLNPPDAAGVASVRPPGNLLPGGEYRFRSSRALSPARWRMLEERLEARADTTRIQPTLRRVGPVEFALGLQKDLGPGQVLRLRLRPMPPDTVPRQLASGMAVDSSRIGSLGFRIPRRWAGWTFLLQGTAFPEKPLAPVAADSVFSGPLIAGWYRLAAFFDRDGDGLWHPGSLRPWAAQEPYAAPLDSVRIGRVFVDLTGRLRAAADSGAAGAR